MSHPLRVAVFLDWQNVYMRARGAFCLPSAPFTDGQVHPLMLAELLVSRGPRHQDRTLWSVNIHRGIPDQRHDPLGFAAARRQVAAWKASSPLVNVQSRTLRYLQDDAGKTTVREKGVDVALAVQVVTGAVERLYDVAIVMSADQDLVPAVQYVYHKHRTVSDPSIEVAAWDDRQSKYPQRITLGRGAPYCHWLTRQDYLTLHDARDYTR